MARVTGEMSSSIPDAVRVTLPDGSIREVPRGAPVRAVAEAIGPRLAKAAVAARLDGQVVDLIRPIEADASLQILTERDAASLDVLRHSAAHISRRPCAGCVRMRRSGSVPPSRTAFTTTSK